MSLRPDSTPAPRRGAQTRERILQVAEQLIARDGVEGFELKEVAAQVGIRAPSIFAHFKGRDDLAEAVSRRVGQVIVEQLAAPGDDPRVALAGAVRSLVAHLADHPAHVRVLLADLARSRDARRPTGAAVHVLEAERRVATLLERGRARGAFREVRADRYIAHVLGGILSSLAWYGWDEAGNLQGPVSVADLQAEAVEAALRYLLPA